jgi:DNA-directed RNA polymerase subunit F
MLAEDLARAQIYEDQLSQNVADICSTLLFEVNLILKTEMTRKDFAINTKAEPFIKSIIFHLWDKNFPVETISDEVMSRLRDACEHEQKFERLKPTLLKGCVW